LHIEGLFFIYVAARKAILRPGGYTGKVFRSTRDTETNNNFVEWETLRLLRHARGRVGRGVGRGELLQSRQTAVFAKVEYTVAEQTQGVGVKAGVRYDW
jgi:hypothetical protein